MNTFRKKDFLGHLELKRALKSEREIYELNRNASVSSDLADRLSRNFDHSFVNDPVSLSDRSDFRSLGDHYDPMLNLVRSNLKKSSPSVIAHELGHAFTIGREARGQAGLYEKLKYYARLMAGSIGQSAIAVGSADLAIAAKNKGSYLRGGILTGAGLAASVGSALSIYRDEARATEQGLKALSRTLSDPSGVAIRQGDKLQVLTDNEIQEAMEAGRANLEAALGTYRKSLPIGTAVSSGLSGAIGAALGSLLPGKQYDTKAMGLAAAAGLGNSVALAILLESAMGSKAGSKKRSDAYKLTGDTSVKVLRSRRD
jgi:hypothetical protein